MSGRNSDSRIITTVSSRGSAVRCSGCCGTLDSERHYEHLATTDPDALIPILRDPNARPADLTFAVEVVNRVASPSADLRAAAVALLAHHDAVVREGAIMGAVDLPEARETFTRMAESDPSPAVRTVAREALDAIEQRPCDWPTTTLQAGLEGRVCRRGVHRTRGVAGSWIVVGPCPSRTPEKPAQPAPRYDAVYDEGMRHLDALAGPSPDDDPELLALSTDDLRQMEKTDEELVLPQDRRRTPTVAPRRDDDDRGGPRARGPGIRAGEGVGGGGAMVTPASPPDLDAIEAAERGAGAPDRTVLALVAYAREISTRFGRYREEAEVDREVSRAQVRNLESTIDAAVLAERERCLSIVRSQPYYPDTKIGKRQQWVKGEIERRILASAPPHGLDGMRAASWLPSIDDGMPADDPELTALSPQELRATVAWWRERCREWSTWAGILCARIGAIPVDAILGAVRSREAIERAIDPKRFVSDEDALRALVPEEEPPPKPVPRIRYERVTCPECHGRKGGCGCTTCAGHGTVMEPAERVPPPIACPSCGESEPARLIFDEDAHEIGCGCGNVFPIPGGAC